MIIRPPKIQLDVQGPVDAEQSVSRKHHYVVDIDPVIGRMQTVVREDHWTSPSGSNLDKILYPSANDDERDDAIVSLIQTALAGDKRYRHEVQNGWNRQPIALGEIALLSNLINELALT